MSRKPKYKMGRYGRIIKRQKPTPRKKHNLGARTLPHDTESRPRRPEKLSPKIIRSILSSDPPHIDCPPGQIWNGFECIFPQIPLPGEPEFICPSNAPGGGDVWYQYHEDCDSLGEGSPPICQYRVYPFKGDYDGACHNQILGRDTDTGLYHGSQYEDFFCHLPSPIYPYGTDEKIWSDIGIEYNSFDCDYWTKFAGVPEEEVHDLESWTSPGNYYCNANAYGCTNCMHNWGGNLTDCGYCIFQNSSDVTISGIVDPSSIMNGPLIFLPDLVIPAGCCWRGFCQ